VGAGVRGASMGPEALRVAGLREALQARGLVVHDRGNLAGPPNPWQPALDGYRHLPEVIAWNRAVHEAVHAECAAGHLPILLGGDHCLAIGSISAVARHCRAAGKGLRVLWLDAHADFNTCALTPSGNLHGMPMACLCGHGPEALVALGGATPAIDARAHDRVRDVILKKYLLLRFRRELEIRGLCVKNGKDETSFREGLKHFLPRRQSDQMRRFWTGADGGSARKLTTFSVTVTKSADVMGLSFAYAAGEKVVVHQVEPATFSKFTEVGHAKRVSVGDVLLKVADMDINVGSQGEAIKLIDENSLGFPMTLTFGRDGRQKVALGSKKPLDLVMWQVGKPRRQNRAQVVILEGANDDGDV
jgi:hypothetical protein